jgi:hypothetical protein
MRSLSTATLALTLCLLPALRAESLPNLTVLLSIDGKASSAALKELKTELNAIMKDTGRTLDVRLRSQTAPNETFNDLVLVKLKGTCTMQRLVPFMDERGPLAWTHSVDGAVLPFAEVSCDRIANAVAGALWGGERKQADQLLGRALGRVLAHELYHILGKTHEHNADGSLAKEALSAKQLISDKRITFDMRDLNRMNP